MPTRMPRRISESLLGNAGHLTPLRGNGYRFSGCYDPNRKNISKF
jgi:hypothetical protein